MSDLDRVRVAGPLAAYVEGFSGELAEQGYTAVGEGPGGSGPSPHRCNAADGGADTDQPRPPRRP